MSSISLRQRGVKKTWDYKIVDSKGKLIYSKSGFRTKKEAEFEAKSVQLQLADSSLSLSRNISLFHLWEHWMLIKVKPLNKADATMKHHERRGALIKEYFKDKPLIKIKPSDYQKFINNYAKTNSRDNVGRMHSEIKKMLELAKRDGLIFKDFSIGVLLSGKKPKKTKDERYIHSSKDYEKLIEYINKNLDYRASVIRFLLLVQLKTGLRFGEVLGLTWDCVDYERMEIKTYRRYDSVRKKFTNAKTPTSIRTIPIDEFTLQKLKELQNQQIHLNCIHKDNLIFNDMFYGIPTNNGVNKHLQSLLKELKIKPYNMTATGIRHTYASNLLTKIDIWAVAKLLGHSNIEQITKTYGHLLKEHEENERNEVRKYFSKI